MKNWIYAALAAFLATGCAPHGGYTLTGEVPEAWEGKPVVLSRNTGKVTVRLRSVRSWGSR